jgi:Flp pilus assembly pilin Flp
MVEYGLILVLVAVVVIASLLLMPGPLNTIFNNVVSGLRGSNP